MKNTVLMGKSDAGNLRAKGLLILCGIVLFSFSALSEVCVWTGEGGDGKWSTAKNWDVPPVSARGDTLRFRVGTLARVIQNDYDSFSVTRILVEPAEGLALSTDAELLHLTGGTIILTGGKTAWTNSTALTLDAPIRVGSGTTYMFAHSKIVFNGKITLDKGAYLYVAGSLNRDTNRRTIINGEIYGPEATFCPNRASGGYLGTEIRGPFTLKCLYCSYVSSLGHSYVDIWSSGNKLDWLATCYGSGVRLRVPDVCASNVAGTGGTCMSFSGWLGENGCNRYYLYANQSFDRLDELGGRVDKDTRHIYGTSATDTAPYTLTLWATASSTSFAILDGAVSLVYAPKGNHTLTLTNNLARAHATTGTLDIRAGTLVVGGPTRFTNLSGIMIGPGAKLLLDSTTTESSVFGAVQNVEMEALARLDVTKRATSVFGSSPTACVRMAGTARISLDADKTLTVGSLIVDGVPKAAATYTSATLPQLESGTLVVKSAAPAGTYWTGAGDGSTMTAADNWSAGAPADGTVARVEKSDTYTLTLAALAGGLAGANMNGLTTLVAPAGITAITPMWDIGRGTTVSVGTLATLAYDGTSFSQAATDVTLAIHDGGKLLVAGGDLALDNIKGRIRLYGTGSEKGTLEISSGTATIVPSAKEHGVYVENGGLVKVTGGKLDARVISYGTSGLMLEGGTLEVTNEAAFLADTSYVRSLGHGEVIFSDHAVLTNRASGSRFFFSSIASGKRLHVSFRDHARVCIPCSSGSAFSIHDGYVDDTYTVCDFDSDADHLLGYSTFVSGAKGSGEMNLKRGTLRIGAYGLTIAGVNGNPSTRDGQKPVGTVNVSGGSIINSQNSSGWSDVGSNSTFNSGLVVGSGEYVTVGNSSFFTGYLNVSGGCITNMSYFILGAGQAFGAVRQTGGVVYCQRTWTSGGTYEHDFPAVIGCAGGEGRYEILGGSWYQKNDLHVGGTPLATFRYMKQGDKATTYPKDRHDAKGLLRIGGNSALTCERLVDVGADGAGTIEVLGSAATIDFQQSLTLTNATSSTVRFIADAQGVTPIAVKQTLTIAAGSRLEVDLRAYPAYKKVKLFSYKTKKGAFSPENVTLLASGDAQLVETSTALYAKRIQGLVLYVR